MPVKSWLLVAVAVGDIVVVVVVVNWLGLFRLNLYRVGSRSGFGEKPIYTP